MYIQLYIIHYISISIYINKYLTQILIKFIKFIFIKFIYSILFLFIYSFIYLKYSFLSLKLRQPTPLLSFISYLISYSYYFTHSFSNFTIYLYIKYPLYTPFYYSYVSSFFPFSFFFLIFSNPLNYGY
jgi:hypothetical protein